MTAEMLLGTVRYAGYAYAYPHKMSYRPISPAVPLEEAWAQENTGSLLLYLHIPFCRRRCGYCNLFAIPGTDSELIDRYIDAALRQAQVTRNAIPAAQYAQFALGGGTPTCLSFEQLRRILDGLVDATGADLRTIPASAETSPDTADKEKLSLLRSRGISRISIGVQSFLERETQAASREQQAIQVHDAIVLSRKLGFACLNLDLIYGLPGQTPESFLESLRTAVGYHPEELYLYPLYVRPKTVLEGMYWQEDVRLECYRAGRQYLLQAGYQQHSMRLFRRSGALQPGTREGAAEYCCQDDGMVGIGCGARSYTRNLHYSCEYAVGRPGVGRILQAYVARNAADFAAVDYGCRLNVEEQKRRWIIKSLLRIEGLDLRGYVDRFGTSALEDFPQIGELHSAGLMVLDPDRLAPTPLGLEWSDAIGPWLASEAMRNLACEFTLQ